MLSDKEKQELIRLIEGNRPLPDKYRWILFDSNRRQVELVWNGKTPDVCATVLPFQTIEHIDEPRAEKPASEEAIPLFSIDERGRQLRGWTNKLIWGDNKLILSALKNGPLRREIEAQGGLKLIYNDPPFDVGADFTMPIKVGENTFTKQPNILEEIAYRDTWGEGADSYLSMIYERLLLMRDLLADDGSIYMHCDWRLNSHIRLVLNEIFGSKNFRNEIAWRKTNSPKAQSTCFGNQKDTIFLYSKSSDVCFHPAKRKPDEKYLKSFRYKDERGRYQTVALSNTTDQGGFAKMQSFEWRGKTARWVLSYQNLEKVYLDELSGPPVSDIWTDEQVSPIQASESLYYPTQKPEKLIERIIKASSNEGDLVADFFCGSGTTAAVAEKLGRKWIASDLGKFAIPTTRKRMIAVQRERKQQGQNYRAFEILNLGKYERQHFVAVNRNLRPSDQQRQRHQKRGEFVQLILHAYCAQKIEQSRVFPGKKYDRMVVVGSIDMAVNRLDIEEVIGACRRHRVTKVDVLGFEFEMGLFPHASEEAKSKGIALSPKYIPREVFDKRAVERNQVVFHDMAYIGIRPHIEEGKAGKLATVAVELAGFSVYWTQDSIANAEMALEKKRSGSKIIVDNGQIVKVSKDKQGVLRREVLTRQWTDWIDYWAVDYEFESKKERIWEKDEETGKWREQWTGGYVFENEWQSFRTRKEWRLELVSAPRECLPGRRKLAVKVVDIFGNDTMKIIEVTV